MRILCSCNFIKVNPVVYIYAILSSYILPGGGAGFTISTSWGWGRFFHVNFVGVGVGQVLPCQLTGGGTGFTMSTSWGWGRLPPCKDRGDQNIFFSIGDVLFTSCM